MNEPQRTPKTTAPKPFVDDDIETLDKNHHLKK
jgi:hypothetical protein